jgi:hypothetical protein
MPDLVQVIFFISLLSPSRLLKWALNTCFYCPPLHKAEWVPGVKNCPERAIQRKARTSGVAKGGVFRKYKMEEWRVNLQKILPLYFQI